MASLDDKDPAERREARLQAENAASRERIEQLEQYLRDPRSHRLGCATRNLIPGHPSCTCGLDALLEKKP